MSINKNNMLLDYISFISLIAMISNLTSAEIKSMM